jgi:hypothetical protein
MIVVVVRNGEEKLRIPAKIINGIVYEANSGYPVWDGLKVKDAGIDTNALMAKTKAHKLTDADKPYMARIGDNGGGLVVMNAREWDKQEYDRKAPEREAKAKLMAELFPGLDLLRAALDDEARYQRQFNRMMEDEYNDGARPPAPIKVKYADVAPKYPAAVAYLRAESYTYSDNYAKSGAGTRAVKRLEAGEDYKLVLADMESEWQKHVDEHIWD